MTGLAVGLVLGSAFFHAIWNLFAKRVSGGVAFVWLISALPGLIYAPLAIGVLLIEQPHIGWEEMFFIVVSSGLQTVYYLALNRGYRFGDLSLVYPLVRGSGVLFSTVAAIILLSERPTPLALVGAALIGVSMLALTGDPRKIGQSVSWQAVGYALFTGTLIACYTLWDKHGVGFLLIPPLFYEWANEVWRAALLTPLVVQRWDEVRAVWRDHRKETIGVAVFSPLAYIMVLTALAFSPVSYVAPMRQFSILFGTVLGARLLAEGEMRRRLPAAGAMVAGVIALAAG